MLLPLVAGSLLGGAFFHMIPAAVRQAEEVNKQRDLKRSALHFGCFLVGAAILYVLATSLGG